MNHLKRNNSASLRKGKWRARDNVEPGSTKKCIIKGQETKKLQQG